MATQTIGKLAAILTLNDKGFQVGMQRVSALSKKFKTDSEAVGSVATSAFAKIGAAVGGTALAYQQTSSRLMGFVRGQGELIDYMVRLSKSTGLSVEMLSSLQYIAQKTDVEFETLTRSVQFFNKTVGNAAASGNSIVGFSAADLRSMGTEKALLKIADAIQQVKDPMDRARIATAMFGREGQDMIPILESGSKGMRELMEAARNVGAVFSEETVPAIMRANDAIKDLEIVKATAKREAAELVSPVVESHANMWTRFYSNLTRVFHMLQRVDAQWSPEIVARRWEIRKRWPKSFQGTESKNQDGWDAVHSKISATVQKLETVSPLFREIGSSAERFGKYLWDAVLATGKEHVELVKIWNTVKNRAGEFSKKIWDASLAASELARQQKVTEIWGEYQQADEIGKSVSDSMNQTRLQIALMRDDWQSIADYGNSLRESVLAAWRAGTTAGDKLTAFQEFARWGASELASSMLEMERLGKELSVVNRGTFTQIEAPRFAPALLKGSAEAYSAALGSKTDTFVKVEKNTERANELLAEIRDLQRSTDNWGALALGTI